MRKVVWAGLVLILQVTSVAAGPGPEIEDFLPNGVQLDERIPRPSETLAFEVGEWHVRPDQIVRYLERLAEASPRVRLEIQGRTHEGRPQPLLIITSESNQQRLESIREAHLEALDPRAAQPTEEELETAPAVVWLGYSVHGNEASGANASLPVAYYLAAAKGEEVEALLDGVVILIDPSLNPDGLGRFAEWVNSHRGRQLVGALEHRERQEPWPGGRTNHYWFDLNRDWLLAQQPESRARLQTFRRWRPHLVGDYHEMGGDATYFFQPGVPSRIHPLTPTENLDLTRKIAAFHAATLDRNGRLYYSEETFDDFYPGKGSTYPDLNGGIGVLFEQATTRGHLRQGRDRKQAFPFAVQNHVLTSFSMLEGASKLRRELLDYQRKFFVTALEEAAKDPRGALLLDFDGDRVRAHHLLDILRAHGIEVYRPSRAIEQDDHRYTAEGSFLIPYAQPQYRLLDALTQRLLEFGDSTFYDVSSWSLPLAFGARESKLGRKAFDEELLGERWSAIFPARSFTPVDNAYAYLFEWSDHLAPRALARLLAAGARVRVASRSFVAQTEEGEREFSAGTLMIPVVSQEESFDLVKELARSAEDDGIRIWTAASGWTSSGGDFGGPGMLQVPVPSPLLVVGSGVSGYEAGEIWHLLDHHFGLEVPLIERELLADLDLDPYSHLLLVDGAWDGLEDEVVTEIRRWVKKGGVVVATRRAAEWAGVLAESKSEETPETAPEIDEESIARVAYADYDEMRAAQLVSGAIVQLEIDTTHPLFFGYSDNRIPVFHRGTFTLEKSRNPWENVAFYSEDPLLAGYASEKNRRKLSGEVAVVAARLGDGAVIRITDNPAFRGFWHGTEKIYLSAIFFGSLIQETASPEDWK